MGRYVRKDHLYQKAKSSGYRSRAAYKLQELDRRFRLLRGARNVLDLGCYPGGWIQVAAERIGAKGMCVGVDCVEVDPLSDTERGAQCDVVLLRADVFGEAMIPSLRQRVPEGFDVVLSDMSPKLSGIKFRDAYESSRLALRALEVGCAVLRPGGALVAKIFPGEEETDVKDALRTRFRRAHRAHLESTRSSSNELYMVGLGFSGPSVHEEAT